MAEILRTPSPSNPHTIMETILFLAHSETDGSLAKPALEALGVAASLASAPAGPKLIVGLIGENVKPAAKQIGSCGATRWLSVAGPMFGQSRYGTDAAAAEAICRAAQPSIVLAAATPRFNRCLAGLAQRLGGRVDTHVTSLVLANSELLASRWFYRQRMEAEFTRAVRPWCILLETGIRAIWQGQPGEVQLDAISTPSLDACTHTTVVGVRVPAGDTQTIRPEAKFLFVAGAGWTKKQADGQLHIKEAEKLILECLTFTRASLGSSKSLVDLGGEGQAVLPFLTHSNQVGQTGSTPRHSKGLATCCHGEEPHTVGWRFITERRAVNLDPGCGWARGKADVLYVADAFAVVKKVNELVKRAPL